MLRHKVTKVIDTKTKGKGDYALNSLREASGALYRSKSLALYKSNRNKRDCYLSY